MNLIIIRCSYDRDEDRFIGYDPDVFDPDDAERIVNQTVQRHKDAGDYYWSEIENDLASRGLYPLEGWRHAEVEL